MNTKRINAGIFVKRIVMILITAMGAYYAYPFFDTTNIQGFIALTTNVSGTLAGFLLTCVTILVGIDNALIKNLRRYGHLKKLLNEMFALIVVLLLLVLLGGINMLFPIQYKPIVDKGLFVLFFIAVVQFAVAFRRFYLIIKVSAQTKK